MSITVQPVGEEGEAVTVLFNLAQNYPNPFGRETTIEFAIPEGGLVVLDVFDLTGRRVARLVDAELEAGRHAAVWEARGLASGHYFFRLQAGSHAKTLRAVLIR